MFDLVATGVLYIEVLEQLAGLCLSPSPSSYSSPPRSSSSLSHGYNESEDSALERILISGQYTLDELRILSEINIVANGPISVLLCYLTGTGELMDRDGGIRLWWRVVQRVYRFEWMVKVLLTALPNS